MRGRKRSLLPVWMAAAVWGLSVAGATAEEKSATAEGAAQSAAVRPVLAPDTTLLAKIAALPDNTWMKLPPVKVTGDLSWLRPRDEKRRFGPNGRDYSNWMVWAPERKRALYCGGGHNIDPLNDVWEYDLASNTWVCLSAADSLNPRMKRGQSLADFVRENAAFKDGVVTTKSGGPLRPAHTWCGLCYDPGRRLMLWLEPHQGLIFTDKAAIAKGLGMTLDQFNAQRKPGSYIWAFNPERRRWAGVRTGLKGGEGAIMLYIPDRKSVWLKSGTRVRSLCLYDIEKRTLKDLSTTGMPGYGTVGAYDPNTRTVVVLNVRTTYTYSMDGNAWKTVQDPAPAGGRDASCYFHYDPVARCFVLFSSAVEPRLWLYGVEKNEWTDPNPKGDGPGRRRLAGYYDPDRNVTVHYNGRGVWVYRCKRSAPRPSR